MNKLYWVISNFEQNKSLNEIDFEWCFDVARSVGYDIEMAYVSKTRYCSEDEMKAFNEKKPKNLSLYLYGESHTENQCLFDVLLKVKAERYFVCDARYLEHKTTIFEMLELASYYKVHFVRCKMEYDGIFAVPVKYVKNLHNKVLSFVKNTKNEKYVRNFVIFNDDVWEKMEQRPSISAVIRETDMLFNANTEIVQVPEGFKRAKHYLENWTSYLIGGTSLILCLWCFISMFILRTDLNLFTWLLIGIICFGVVALLSLNVAVENSKTVFYRPFWKREELKPIFEIEKEVEIMVSSDEKSTENEVQEEIELEKEKVTKKKSESKKVSSKEKAGTGSKVKAKDSAVTTKKATSKKESGEEKKKAKTSADKVKKELEVGAKKTKKVESNESKKATNPKKKVKTETSKETKIE